MKRFACVTVAVAHLATALNASADCMGTFPRYAEVKVETCESAVPLVKSVIANGQYTSQETLLINLSVENLYVIHAKVLAEMDMIEWYSRNGIRRFVGRREPIETMARDYMVISYGGCEDLLTGKAQIFDINANTPCRDIVSIIDGKKAAETDARLILDLPLVEYLPYQEQLEDMSIANKLLQMPSETPAP